MGVLSFFAGPLGKWVVIGLLVAVFGGWCWFKGNEHGTAKLTEYIGEQAKEAVRIVTARGKVTERIVTEYIRVAGETKVVKETTEKEVVRYETLKLDRTMLSTAAVSLHDAAAANAVPDASRAIDGSASSVAAATLLETCTANYATYHEVADRLRGLQGWVRAQAAVR